MAKKLIILFITAAVLTVYYVGKQNINEIECSQKILQSLIYAETNSKNIVTAARKNSENPQLFEDAKWCIGRDKDTIGILLDIYKIKEKETDFPTFAKSITNFCEAVKNDTPSDYRDQNRALLHKSVEDEILRMKIKYENLVKQNDLMCSLYNIMDKLIPIWSAILSILIFFFDGSTCESKTN